MGIIYIINILMSYDLPPSPDFGIRILSPDSINKPPLPMTNSNAKENIF